MLSFAELHNQISASGWTATANPLEDLLVKHLPSDYYKVWRHIWRKTVGWNKTADFLSMRDISDATGVHQNCACRALHFFSLLGLVDYVPGQQGKVKSHITVLPHGLPGADTFAPIIADHVIALLEVEHREAKVRKQTGNRNFCFTTTEFKQKIGALVDTQFATSTWETVMACPRATVR